MIPVLLTLDILPEWHKYVFIHPPAVGHFIKDADLRLRVAKIDHTPASDGVEPILEAIVNTPVELKDASDGMLRTLGWDTKD